MQIFIPRGFDFVVGMVSNMVPVDSLANLGNVALDANRRGVPHSIASGGMEQVGRFLDCGPVSDLPGTELASLANRQQSMYFAATGTRT
jgi:hypothetical protein